MSFHKWAYYQRINLLKLNDYSDAHQIPSRFFDPIHDEEVIIVPSDVEEDKAGADPPAEEKPAKGKPRGRPKSTEKATQAQPVKKREPSLKRNQGKETAFKTGNLAITKLR